MASGQVTGLLRYIRQLVGTPDSGSINDPQLLRRYAENGDGDAFATLVQRHGAMVQGVCQRILGNSHDAEDAFQAVFVVLANKAGAGGWQESIGPWLHEVSYRVALKARARGLRRAEHERRAVDMRSSTTAAESSWTDLRGVLDRELDRLPANYRAPMLLCYLEGKSNEEAAEQLGWPAGTVKSRLSRGRDLLRERLVRAGLALSAEALVLLLSQNAVASVPAALADGAIKAAKQVTAGQAVGGLTGQAAALAQGALRTMWISKMRMAAVVVLLLVLAGWAGWATFQTLAADPATATQKEIVLPKDSKAVVLSMEVGGGMLKNASPEPFLLIQADGKVIRTDRVTGAKRESRLSPLELQELLRFVIQDNDFFNVDRKKIDAGVAQAQAGKPFGIAVGDGRTTGIRVDANNKRHDVSSYAAATQQAQYPKVKPLAQFVAIEWRLDQLGYLMELAPLAGEAAKKPITLPKDPKAVVLSISVSHKEIPTRKEARPNGGFNIYQGSPRADQTLEIQADGRMLVSNRVNGTKKEAKLTALQVQDLLRFVIQDNDFFNQSSAKLADNDNPDARKFVISVNADDKQHQVSVDGPPFDKGKVSKVYSWLNTLARTYVWPSGNGWEN
jgi:RNA polymerase sigma factor (sigma-70 family)